MSLLGGLGDILFGGGLFGYGDPSNMANAAAQQQQWQNSASAQQYYDQLRNYQYQQHQQYQQSATPKPASDDNIIDAEFEVLEIDGQKLLGSDEI